MGLMTSVWTDNGIITRWRHTHQSWQSKLASLNPSINNTYSLYIAMKLYTSHKSTIQRTPIRAYYLGHSPETWSLYL